MTDGCAALYTSSSTLPTRISMDVHIGSDLQVHTKESIIRNDEEEYGTDKTHGVWEGMLKFSLYSLTEFLSFINGTQ